MFTKIIRILNSVVERFTPRQLLAGAAAIGLLVVLMVYWTLTHIESSMKVAQPKPIKLTKVVVAKVDIPRGAIIDKNMLKVKEFVADSLPKGTASDFEEFINLPTKVEIFAGDIVTTDKVFTDTRQAGFIGMIPEDCRAVTIPIDNLTGIAGLLKAGDQVDIILVMPVEEGGTRSMVFMENVTLLSVNRDAERNLVAENKASTTNETSLNEKSDGTENPNEESMVESVVRNVTGIKRLPTGSGVGTATLALHPDEITRVIAATSIGKLYLALRPLKPRSDSMFIRETDYYTATDSSEPPPPKSLPAPTPPIPIIPGAPPQISPLPAPNLPVIPGNATSPALNNDAFEIIQWGK